MTIAIGSIRSCELRAGREAVAVWSRPSSTLRESGDASCPSPEARRRPAGRRRRFLRPHQGRGGARNTKPVAELCARCSYEVMKESDRDVISQRDLPPFELIRGSAFSILHDTPHMVHALRWFGSTGHHASLTSVGSISQLCITSSRMRLPWHARPGQGQIMVQRVARAWLGRRCCDSLPARCQSPGTVRGVRCVS